MKKILQMTDDQCITHIITELTMMSIPHKLGFKDNKLMYIYAEQKNSTMMLVSHLDTVDSSYATPPKVRQAGQILYSASPNRVLGADDRAGVYSILEILKARYSEGKQLPTTLFTNYEEIGGLGVGHFCKQDHKLDHVHLMIELDRQGKDDWVAYQYNDKQVDNYIEKFGFHESYGCYSDIADLSSEYGIPSVNLSIGYEHQHTARETLNLDWMNRTIKMVHKMLDKPIDKLYGCEDGYQFISFKPEVKVGDRKKIYSVIDKNTIAGRNACPYCGEVWWNCDCGMMADCLEQSLNVTQMEYALSNVLFINDSVYQQLIRGGVDDYSY